MSPVNTPSTPALPFHVSAWLEPRSDEVSLCEPPPEVAVIGLGESAHFVAELNHLRAQVVLRLRENHAVTHLALEVGSDEAPAIQAWLRETEPRPLRDVVGPLTYCLYGTFLAALRNSLEPEGALTVLGVDLPNSLTIEPSLTPLSALIGRLDPATADLVSQARELATQVRGGSAAASAFSWMEIEPADQDALTVCLTRLSARLDALGTAAHGTSLEADWLRARRLADAALTTDLMLRVMAELFSGGGLPADTTLRERFIANRLFEAVETLDAGQRIVYVAHNNHIQKSPVVFDNVVAAFPVGQLLAQRLGRRYWAVALTHLDSEVPEMVVPGSTDVGFRVERTAATAIQDHSIEAAALGEHGEVLVVRPTPEHDGGDVLTTSIRSQSASAEVPVGAFEATLVVRTATTDPAVEHLVAAHEADEDGAGM